MQYSVFISYRREGAFDTACLIAEKLRNRGYRVFLDVESMRSGKFNEQLYSVIGQCRDFVLVLPPGGLDRCDNGDDWLRLEILHAMKHNKNIIPVMLKGFSWPRKMPEGLEGLENYQGVAASDINYFDSAMDKLMSYLESRPAYFSRKAVRYSALALLSACILAVAAVIGIYGSSVPVCKEQVTRMVSKLSVLNVLVSESDAVMQEWKDFYSSYSSTDSKERLALRQDIAKTLDFYEKEIGRIDTDTVSVRLTDSQKRNLQFGGMDPAAIELFHNSLYPSFFDDAYHAIDILRKYLQAADIYEMSVSTADVNAKIFRHSVYSVYYAFLSECSELSDKIMQPYYEASSMWTNLPVNVGTHLPKREYERLQKSETEKAEVLLSELGHLNTALALALEKDQKRLDDLKEKVAIVASQNEINDRVNRIIRKTGELTAMQKELQETADKVDEMVRATIDKCRLSPDDDQYYMWGKIIRLGSLMETTLVSRENAMLQKEKEKAEAEAMGFDTSSWFEPTYRIAPKDILGEIHDRLDQYLTYFPETSIYVPQARRYFSDVLEGKCKPGGMIVMATKDNLEHPVLKLGDIVVSRNGQTVNTAEQFSFSKATTGEDHMTFLRLSGDSLVEHIETVPANDIPVGLLPLKE